MFTFQGLVHRHAARFMSRRLQRTLFLSTLHTTLCRFADKDPVSALEHVNGFSNDLLFVENPAGLHFSVILGKAVWGRLDLTGVSPNLWTTTILRLCPIWLQYASPKDMVKDVQQILTLSANPT